MSDLLIKYMTIFGLGMFKFAIAPLVAVGMKLSFLPTFLLSIGGMMTTVLFLAFAGERLRPWILNTFFPKRRIFTPRNRKIVKIWRKYGIVGVAFLTPIFFSPVIGMMIALAFGEKRQRIILTMFISALFWGSILSASILFFGEKVIQQFLG